MATAATPDVVAVLLEWARRADEALARRGARNAATALAAVQGRRLEEHRTLRDLAALTGRHSNRAARRRA